MQDLFTARKHVLNVFAEMGATEADMAEERIKTLHAEYVMEWLAVIDFNEKFSH